MVSRQKSSAKPQATQQRLQEIIRDLQRFRSDVEAAEIRLFRACRKVELEEERVWGQFGTFEGLLEDNKICDSRRYRDFVLADEELGQKVVDKIGAPAAVQVTKIADRSRRAKYVEAAEKRVEEKGVTWSDQQARTERLQIGGSEPRDSSYNKKVDRERQLYNETISLKRENRELRSKIKELEEENAKLLRKLETASDRRAKASKTGKAA